MTQHKPMFTAEPIQNAVSVPAPPKGQWFDTTSPPKM